MSMSFNGRYRILRPMAYGNCIAAICLFFTGNAVNAAAEGKQMLKLALKLQREPLLAITIDIGILLFMHWHLFIFQFSATS